MRGSIEIGLYLNPGDFFTKNKALFENSEGGGGVAAHQPHPQSTAPI